MLDKMIYKVLRTMGLEVRRVTPVSSSPAQIVTSLRKFGIDLVIDVGANAGQFASEIRDCGYCGQIVSIEPISEAHHRLVKASRRDGRWRIHPRCALGGYDGEAEINIAGNSVSSSILPMLGAHRSIAPESTYQGKEKVSVYRLDTIIEPYLAGAHAPFLKIDTQGFESQVLDGARETLPRVKGILLELSLVPLYEGQNLWRELIERLEADGFTLWALQLELTDVSDGRSLQVNGIFFRI